MAPSVTALHAPTEAVIALQAEARLAFQEFEVWMYSAQTLDRPIHEVEAEQFVRSREVNRKLLEAHIRARGQGNVGPAIERRSAEENSVYTHRRLQVRHENTLFGEVRIERLGYHRRGCESIRPLDEELQLPERLFSYPVQRTLVQRAVQGPFDEAIEGVKELTGLPISKCSAEEVVQAVAQDFDAFYAQCNAASAQERGPIVVGSVDGKGVPMVKESPSVPVVRLRRGEKANKKRMATVAAVYTTSPRIRTPEEVVESLFHPELRLVSGSKDAKAPVTRTKPENKRIWASLKKTKEQIIEAMREEMRVRDPAQKKTHVVITDGERALQIRVARRLPGVLLILDWLHVLEKLWTIGHTFYAEGSTEAETWVREHALRLLRGEVSQVIKGIRQSATKRRVGKRDRKIIDTVTGYFARNQTRMHYNQYLAQGLPIASGAVEGACKNLVKDRMERSGMRWKIPTAEAMLQMRALYLSGDFEAYWNFHIRQEQARLQAGRTWHPVQRPLVAHGAG